MRYTCIVGGYYVLRPLKMLISVARKTIAVRSLLAGSRRLRFSTIIIRPISFAKRPAVFYHFFRQTFFDTVVFAQRPIPITVRGYRPKFPAVPKKRRTYPRVKPIRRTFRERTREFNFFFLESWGRRCYKMFSFHKSNESNKNTLTAFGKTFYYTYRTSTMDVSR